MSVLTESQILAAVRGFLLPLMPGGSEVIRTQNNRAPPPKAPNWIAMTPRSRVRLATNIDSWDTTAHPAPTVQSYQQKVELKIQLDVYGGLSADIATAISTLWRDDYACQYFLAISEDLAPLYATDGQQMPLISGEEQYVSRWTMELSLQANLDVSTTQDFATNLAVTVIEVDAAYPPGA